MRERIPGFGYGALGVLQVRKSNEHFSLILCRNVAFTYFGEEDQVAVAKTIHSSLLPGGLLVLGKHE
jgi:chemotaxis methyl-accepting protein methylase